MWKFPAGSARTSRLGLVPGNSLSNAQPKTTNCRSKQGVLTTARSKSSNNAAQPLRRFLYDRHALTNAASFYRAPLLSFASSLFQVINMKRHKMFITLVRNGNKYKLHGGKWAGQGWRWALWAPSCPCDSAPSELTRLEDGVRRWKGR